MAQSMLKQLALRSVIMGALPALAAPVSYFPAGKPWLGGEAWERRLSLDLRLGSRRLENADSHALGMMGAQFFWGPWAGLEAEVRVNKPQAPRTQTRWEFRAPLRISWSAQESLSPYLGWSTGDERQDFWAGLQVRWLVWRLSLLTQVAASLGSTEDSQILRASQQIEQVSEAGERVFSFWGLRVDRQWWVVTKPRLGGDQSEAATTWSLVSGVRF